MIPSSLVIILQRCVETYASQCASIHYFGLDCHAHTWNTRDTFAPTSLALPSVG